MNIDINDHRKIYSIQHDFNAAFPNLKIEFHAKPHKSGGVASDKMVETASKTLGQCRVEHNKGTITVTPNMTIEEIKQNFSDVYGLSVNITKKVGNNWVKLDSNHHLTLADHNK